MRMQSYLAFVFVKIEMREGKNATGPHVPSVYIVTIYWCKNTQISPVVFLLAAWKCVTRCTV